MSQRTRDPLELPLASHERGRLHGQVVETRIKGLQGWEALGQVGHDRLEDPLWTKEVVEPSISVNRKVTVPVGASITVSPRMLPLLDRTLYTRAVYSRPGVSKASYDPLVPCANAKSGPIIRGPGSRA